ncbi:hypothetical protein K443DRAFT_656611 [Laccaria amethystina LaAM-08-1]|uniref:Uncharacterized protein n=1 Tax=Laccaria amethystina LaAM-08-1 TaxID=1095629 RepID=A0A0C9WHF0_9AGAR|nr:hypothetical protein K443DRAFT_656611 [Laccaria amethystina LaAM-08-1]
MPPSQNTTPELYLSLLSGRHGDVSYLSTEQRHNDVGSRLFGRPFPKDPNRLVDLLDALAAVCIRKEKGEVFFVSLAMDPKAVTLYPRPTVISHLLKIGGQLKKLRKVVEPNPSIPADNETSPDPNKTQSRTDGELELQKTIYEHSYRKLCLCFSKRTLAILAMYEITVKSLQANKEDAELLQLTHWALKHIQGCLNATGSEDIPTCWDNLIHESGFTFCIYEGIAHVLLLDANWNRKLSLRWLLKKLFTLHHHIHTITCITCDISITFSQQDILPIIFPPGKKELLVCDKLLKRLQEKAKNKGIELKKRTKVSMKTVVHAESTLLAYHLQHPNINPYHYFGGSKLSCHGCATLFSSFNLVAESFHLPQFFTKGCHNKIYLWWPCPSLEQSKRLQPSTPSLNTEVRKKMIVALSTELTAYVNELHAVVEGPSQPQSDSTAASGDSYLAFKV